MLSTTVTLLYIRSSDHIHLVTESLYPFSNLSFPFPDSPAPVNYFLLSVAVSLVFKNIFRLYINVIPCSIYLSYEKLFCEKCHWNFDRDCITVVDCFGSYGHFNNINSSSLWAQNTFPFIQVFTFFHHLIDAYWSSSFTSLVKFIPQCFILFDAIVNGIVLLTSLFIFHC